MSCAGSLLLIEKMLVGRANEKIKHSDNAISSPAAAALVFILSILQAAIQWRQQINICRVGSIERVEIRDLRESWMGKTGNFAICLTMGKGT